MSKRFAGLGESNQGSLVYADLGPTNTGKTHRAIQRMLELGRGMIGLPLRLLAREVYDRLVAASDVKDVALLTGEERIVPYKPKFYVCTVESMPMDITVPIVVVDEIQLAAHPKRGHTFTDRILHARGTIETWFLGSDTMIDILDELVPTTIVHRSERMSPLRYIQPKRLSALPKRSAVVTFNITHIYELAERMRLAKGGVAIVMGSMSPQSRNAQVELFQSGKVDTLIATDAIGLGLNLDIKHVCFASTRKFDGRDYRYLSLGEMGQIAGRAGRHTQGGTFNLSVDAAQRGALSEGSIQAIEEQVFAPVRKVYYRNSNLDFQSVDHFWKSIQQRAHHSCMIPQREAIDELTMQALLKEDAILKACYSPERIELLWNVCRIPDYVQHSLSSHIRLVRMVFQQLIQDGKLNPVWITKELQKLENLTGNISKLLDNMSKIRTWNFIAHRPDWIHNQDHWKSQLSRLEQTLSDTVHQRLTERFIDEMGHQQERSAPEGVYREGESLWCSTMEIGVFQSLSFIPNMRATQRFGYNTVRTLGREHFAPLANEMCGTILKNPNWRINEHFQICSQGMAIAQISKGRTLREPTVSVLSMGLLTPRQQKQIEVNVQGWLQESIKTVFSLYTGTDEVTRELRFDIRQQIGTYRISRSQKLSKAIRQSLGRSNIVCGKHYLYHRDIYKTRFQMMRFLLYALWNDIDLLPELPEQRTAFKANWPQGTARTLGYYQYAGWTIRADVVDKIRWAKDRLSLNDVASRLGLTLEQAEKVSAAMQLKLSTQSVNQTKNRRRRHSKRTRKET
jgi:ATP-dependent RNA helicase SUPV3L1/SUV3